MRNGVSGVDGGASRRAGVSSVSSSIARVDAGETRHSGLVRPASTIALVEDGVTYLARVFADGPLWYFTPAGDDEVWMIGTGTTVVPGTKVYVASGVLDTTVEGGEAPVPAGQVVGLYFGASAAPGPGTFKYTLFKNGVATLCTFTLTGSGEENRKGKSAVEVPFADGDWLSVEIDVSGTAARASHNGSLRFRPAA